jgi:hypothetical protein
MEDSQQQKSTFGDLPQALVDEMLSESQEIGKTIFKVFNDVQGKKSKLRDELQSSGLLKHDSSFNVQSPPTVCGVDGAYAKEELLSIDLLAAAAVAVEGLTPPSETRFWEAPHHRVYIKEEEHSPETSTILRGVMIGMEQILANKAPHDTVFLDGSMTTPLIFMNQALNNANKVENRHLQVTKQLQEVLPEALKAYAGVVGNNRTDKLWLALPKYTSNREIGLKLGWSRSYDDRALLTLLLEPGELTAPIDFQQPESPWHLSSPGSEGEIEKVKEALSGLKVIYYKPHDWTPALRVELNSSTASNDYQVGMVTQALKYQCSTPGVMEPYPLFLADRMVKSLGSGLPAFRQVVTRQMAEDYEGNVGEIFFNMHGYRTERSK